MSASTVLIADDESMIRWTEEALLKNAGYEVIATVNGQECVERFQKEGPENIALTVLDYRMPVMDGIEAFHRLRAIDPAARILICSASIEEDQLQELISHGAVGAVPKPFTGTAFLEAIERAVA